MSFQELLSASGAWGKKWEERAQLCEEGFKLGGRQVSDTSPKVIVTNGSLWGLQDDKETSINA